MNKRCIICNKNSLLFLNKKKGYSLYKCEICDLITLLPQPNSDDLRKIYSYKNKYHTRLSKKFIITQKKEFLKRLSIADKIINNNDKTVLDLGCSTGEFLDCAKQLGYKTYGVELNKVTAEIATEKGHQIYNGRILDFNSQKKFSVIHLGDIIEHEIDPIKLIKNCEDLLETNGIIIISTPNFDSFLPKITLSMSKILKTSWAHPTPPYHIYQFSLRNLNWLMEKFKLSETYFSKIGLKYELTQTENFEKIKEYIMEKKGRTSNFIKAIFLITIDFLIYLPLFLISKILIKLGHKGDQMVCFFIKNE